MVHCAPHTAAGEAVLDILSEVLEVPAERIAALPDLREHGWSSLSALEALTRLENYFDCKVDLRSFTAATTCQDVLDTLAAACA
jgi:acyl carrier protein